MELPKWMTVESGFEFMGPTGDKIIYLGKKRLAQYESAGVRHHKDGELFKQTSATGHVFAEVCRENINMILFENLPQNLKKMFVERSKPYPKGSL